MSKELIKIITKDGSNLVNAKDLHEFLEVGRDFTTWIKGRIEKYLFEENVDFTVSDSFHQNGGKGGRPEKEYIITIDMAKELSMVENNEKGRQARKYFIQCEKALKEKSNSSIGTLENMLKRIENLENEVKETKYLKEKLSLVLNSRKTEVKKILPPNTKEVEKVQLLILGNIDKYTLCKNGNQRFLSKKLLNDDCKSLRC